MIVPGGSINLNTAPLWLVRQQEGYHRVILEALHGRRGAFVAQGKVGLCDHGCVPSYVSWTIIPKPPWRGHNRDNLYGDRQYTRHLDVPTLRLCDLKASKVVCICTQVRIWPWGSFQACDNHKIMTSLLRRPALKRGITEHPSRHTWAASKDNLSC